MTLTANDANDIKSAIPDGSDHCTISYYENTIPDFIEDELIRLYSHINSSLPYLKNKFIHERISTYVSRENNITAVILLFKINGKKVVIINEMIHVSQTELLKFSNYVFFNFKNINHISFPLIQQQHYDIPFPSQQFDRSEDVVVTLPSTSAMYLQNLSIKTRRNIRYQLKKLMCDFPNFEYQTYQRSEINESHINKIMDLNKNRIEGKNIKYGIGVHERRSVYEQASLCGLVLIVTINGETCGGAINFRLGDSYFGHTIAHDSRFNAYGLGLLCAYLMICENIRLGGKKAHLSWGRYDYKYKLSGVPVEMSRLSIYRSTTFYLSDFLTLLKNKFTTTRINLKISFFAMEQKKGMSGRLISKFISMLRKAKRSLTTP
jgi:Acetyltransferase (GNAT) domain